ncbi:dephospho-CoA kinase [Arthrobacter cryoconiti]|uniref:Dephospho-CoA kinase n=1 Tax=Arthrobacter cryoconiti TaxID=748907 RepID=A0ABV8R1T4_9MICC|nr:dephospho-CoA kinase [Arthrobacter cryoconiti]MCC9069568.1 dephospho-CoA kinase [Arthrobacter cryoconiti]
MLSIGLTGGIASGKSLMSQRFRELGAVVIDADQLARDVVAPGTAGLASVAKEFGPGVLQEDGSLDRPVLGALVFADQRKLAALNAIVHPLVRAAAAVLKSAAEADAIVVQDIPLLIETGQGAHFHLVVVVDAPVEQRMARMVANRGMSPVEAVARMDAQATDIERKAGADVIIDNSGTPESALVALDELWNSRLAPFAANLAANRCAVSQGPAVIVAPNPAWAEQGARLCARIMLAAGQNAVAVEHIGSTSIAGLSAKDVIDLQLLVRDLSDADAVTSALAQAGFPHRSGQWWDNGHDFAGGSVAQRWEKRFHNAADPGRPVNLHVRVAGSPGAVLALEFRNWLRADSIARKDYESLKRRVATEHCADADTAGYAQAKEGYFATAVPKLLEWLRQTGQA